MEILHLIKNPYKAKKLDGIVAKLYITDIIHIIKTPFAAKKLEGVLWK